MSRDFSKISSRIWYSTKFKKVGDFSKLLYFYFQTCRHATSVGIYTCPVHYISGDLSSSNEQVNEAIKQLDDVGLILWNAEEELVCITNWVVSNMPHNRNHTRRIVLDSMAAPGCCEKWMALEEFFVRIPKNKIDPEDLEDIHSEIKKLKKQYPIRIDTVSLQDHTLQDHTKTYGIDDAASGNEPELSLEGQEDNRFDELWAVYPKSGRRKGSRQHTKAVYDKLLAEGISHSVIVAGVISYGDYLKATGEKNRDAERFLKKKLFLEDWPVPDQAGKSQASNLEGLEDDLRGRL